MKTTFTTSEGKAVTVDHRCRCVVLDRKTGQVLSEHRNEGRARIASVGRGWAGWRESTGRFVACV